MPVAPYFSIVTLGVADLDRSIAFYEAIGWEKRGDRAQGIVWFKTASTWIGLFPRGDLADDTSLPLADGLPPFRDITLALNLPTEADVDAAFETMTAAGATLVKAAHRMDWGGYSGYVADPDGHLWELCFNPMFPIDDDGHIEIE